MAAGMAILDAGLTCSASLPCPAEMGGSIHIHGTGSSIVDTVFVCRESGIAPRSWLFENGDELAHIISGELSELRAAAMKPTMGDIRCIAFGHITRMAIWKLRPTWMSNLPTKEKLSIFRAAMDRLGTVDDVKARLSGMTIPEVAEIGGLFALQETRNLVDAVSF